MSKFLAPIHFWLFNKVKIHEGLEKDLESALKDKYGDDIIDIVNGNISKYGDRLPDKPLDEIIDESNIHGWLQSNITVVETRQAAILADVFSKYGNDAVDIAKEVFAKNAIKNAEIAKSEVNISSPEDVYKTLNNYILDGMPCDNAGRVTKSDENILETVQTSCLHVGYWDAANIDIDTMYQLRTIWIESFVSSLNDNFKYSVAVSGSGTGGRSFTHTFARV